MSESYSSVKLPAVFDSGEGHVFTVDIARLEEVEEIFDFLSLHFYDRSPICYLDPFNRCDEKEVEARHQDIRDCLYTPFSLTVRDSNGQLVAVRMNEILEENTGCYHPLHLRKDRPIIGLLDELNRDVDLFELFNTRKVLEGLIVAVDDRYGRHGLAGRLLDISSELAKEAGAGAVKGTPLSDYAYRASMKRGFREIRAVDYATFKFNGSVPFAGMANILSVHSKGRLMARAI